MSDTPTAPRPKRRRVSRKLAGLRHKRILQRLREGRSYSAISEEEGVSVRRLRDIVKTALGDEERVLPAHRRAHAEIARLAPAIALAEAKIADGDLGGIRALLALQKQIDVYAAVTNAQDAPDYAAERQAAVDKVTRLMLHENPYLFADKEPGPLKRDSPDDEASL